MVRIISMLIGCIIAAMVAVNGYLSAHYGVFGAAVIIHLVGVAFSLIVIKIRRLPLNLRAKIPLWLFSGGVIGVFVTIFTNFAFGKISVTSIVALGLFGQTIVSLLIDSFGLFGMKKHVFRKSKIFGLIFALAGILIMFDTKERPAMLAVAFSLLSGVAIALSRTVNAGLSARIGSLQGSFVNHLAGFPVTVIILFMFGRDEPILTNFSLSPSIWIYLGGVLGVLVVALCNIAVPKIPALNLTLLTFIGQAFTGIFIDIVTKQGYSSATFFGGLLVAIGVFTNLAIEFFRKSSET